MTKLVNRAKMTTATTGTGTITLGSASAGYQSFADAGVVNGDVVRYVIEDGVNWEIGTGTYTASGTTLSRTVTESSNSDAAIVLSGTAVVFITAVVADILQPDNNLSELTNTSTARTNLGLAIGTNVQAYDAGLQSISGLTTAADRMIYTTAADTYAVTTLTSAGRAILDDADAAAQRTTLGLVIGTNVQAYDAGLQSISGLTTAADRMIYTTAADTYAVTPLTAAGRALLDDADASAQRTTLGLAIGTNVQAYDADLAAIAGLAVTDGNFIVGNGTTWVAESGSTARTSLGLGSLATLSTINDSNWSGTDLAVANGGTGVSTVPTNGQLLIGNGTGYTVANVTAGTGISVTNGSGSISIAATNNGTVTSVGITAGNLIDVTGGPITSSGSITVDVDLSELTDMTATMVGTDEFVVLDASAQRRKAANEIGLSVFNNDSGFTTNTGTVTSVGGTGTVNGLTLTGTVTSSGNLTLGGTLAISNADWSGTDLSVANGGTGASSFTANNVLLGNGTSAFQVVAPGTSGNILTSNGTTWTSAALPSTVVTTDGTQTLTNKTLTTPAISTPTLTGTPIEDVFAWTSTTGTVSIEPDNGAIQTVTMSGNITGTDGFSAGQAITLMINDGSAYTFTWPTTTWVNNGGVAPTLATSGYTVVALWKISTTLYGALVGDGS